MRTGGETVDVPTRIAKIYLEFESKPIGVLDPSFIRERNWVELPA